MIETAEAIKNLDAILDVEGLDGVFVGNTPTFQHSDLQTFHPSNLPTFKLFNISQKFLETGVCDDHHNGNDHHRRTMR